LEAIALALAAALSWGLADFGAGLTGRRVPVVSLVAGMQFVGTLGAALVLLIGRGQPIAADTAALGVVAGSTTVVGLTALYRALAIGPMSVMAPVSATGVVIPVIVGLATGDHPSTAQDLGIVLAIGGMLAVVRESGDAEEGAPGSRGTALILAVASAIGLGVYYLTVDRVDDGQTSWFLLVGQLTAAITLGVVAAGRRLALPRRADRHRVAALGVLSFGAWALSTAAFNTGHLSLTATIISMYPLVTVGMAVGITREPLSATQTTGLVVAFAGIALIAVG
jgi:drug/metabolite transporter (DMT)-like permease